MNAQHANESSKASSEFPDGTHFDRSPSADPLQHLQTTEGNEPSLQSAVCEVPESYLAQSETVEKSTKATSDLGRGREHGSDLEVSNSQPRLPKLVRSAVQIQIKQYL